MTATLLMTFVVVSCASAHPVHHCIHDTPEMQAQIYGVRNTSIPALEADWHTMHLSAAVVLEMGVAAHTTTTTAPYDTRDMPDALKRAFLRRFHDRIRAETPAISITTTTTPTNCFSCVGCERL